MQARVMNGYYLYSNGGGGPDIGVSRKEHVKIEDGLVFRKLSQTSGLLPFEDWRRSDLERAEDLAARLSREDIAGLMLYSSHQIVPFVGRDGFMGHYDGGAYDPDVHAPDALTDEQKCMIEHDRIRHILQMSVQDAETSAKWSNRLQALCEEQELCIPVNISTDPRHGASGGRAEFKQTGKDVSKWPEGIGMVAAGDPELVRQFAHTAALEYRALGITTALGPQIDLSTEPRWMRMEDTLGSQPEQVIEFVKAYCDGMQTTRDADDGWGRESVLTMVKHWPGGGSGEGGRDAHYPYGCFAVYPAGKFETHLRPFTEGAFHLDGPTGTAASVMPYYTVSWTAENEKVGNAYSRYIIHDLLREKYGFDGVVCTDWGITGDPAETMDSFGSRCYGTAHLSEAERHLRIILNGVDQFGGNDRAQPILQAWEIGDRLFGKMWMRRRMERSAVRLLRNMFRVGLFDQPYLDPDESRNIVGAKPFVDMGRAAQARSVVLLKGKCTVESGRFPLKVYVPLRTISAHKSFIRTMEPEKTVDPLEYCDLPEGMERVSDPEQADIALVFMESPLSDPYDPKDREAGGNGYVPLTLQYRPYTAESARDHSIGYGDAREGGCDRSYRGKRNTCYNENDLDQLEDTRKRMGRKPVFAVMHMHNPAVMSEVEPLADVILVHFGIEMEVLFDMITGRRKPEGKLPYTLPLNMEVIEKHGEDDPCEWTPYCDSEGREYRRGYSAFSGNS